MRRIRGSASAKADLAFLLAGTATGGASRSPAFVFRPNGAAGGNVFTTWASLMAAVSAVSGPKVIGVDDSLAAATVPAGTSAWNLDGCTLVPLPGAGEAVTTLTFEQGAQISFQRMIVDGPLSLTSVSTLAVIQAANFSRLDLLDFAQLNSQAGAAALYQAAAGVTSVIVLSNATLGDTVHNCVDAAAGATIVIHGVGDVTHITHHALGGAGTANYTFTSSCAPDTLQDVATFNQTLASIAAQVAYTPGTAGNWQPSPTETAAALDQLAAPNFVQALALAGGAATTQIITTGNIAKKRSGLVRVSAQQTVSTSAQDNVVFTLQRDGVNIAGAPTIEATSAGVNDFVTASITFIDTLPDAANHTYSILATHTAANLTQAANSGSICAQEL